MAQKGETIVRFDDVSFGYSAKKLILNEVVFNVRRGSKITLMGQNGAGKSTLFHLITKGLSPEDGAIHIAPNLSIAKALDEYEGAMVLVSHVPDFVKKIRIDDTLDLGKL